MNPESGSGNEGIDFTAPETGQESGESSIEDSLWETYGNSTVLAEKDIQEQRNEPFRAGFTDIDNTFYRADRAEQATELAELAEQNSYPLIAVTGNSYEIVKNRIDAGELPHFEIIIGSVGTEIWVLQQDGQSYRQDDYFRNALESSGYIRREVAIAANFFFEQLTDEAPDYGLVYQNGEGEQAYLRQEKEDEVQPFKISFCFFASSEQELAEFSQRAERQFPEQELVICEEINYNGRLQPGDIRKKYNLDILPIAKGGAVDYAAELLGVEQGVVAGDSGNDIDMLIQTKKLNAIVVGGAKAELVNAAQQAGGETKTSFQKITDETGQMKAVYIERNIDRLGPDSIRHAAEVLLRAERISKQKDASAS